MTQTTNNTFPTAEKLKGKFITDALFRKGKWKSCGSLRIILMPVNGESVAKFGVSAPKKNFKRAVDRNRIKRLLRESYRLNKTEYRAIVGEKHAMLFWVSKNKPSGFSEVQEEFLTLLKTL